MLRFFRAFNRNPSPIWISVRQKRHFALSLPVLALVPLAFSQADIPKDTPQSAAQNQTLAPQHHQQLSTTDTENTLLTKKDQINTLQTLGFGFRVVGRVLFLGCVMGPVILSFPFWYLLNRASIIGEGMDWWVVLLRHALEHCGPMYIKLGQWASTRTDIFPSSICSILAELQSHVQPHNFEHTKEYVELAIKRPIHDVFESFEECPVGTGSVAQVHKAVLKGQSSPVAVKVLHPGIQPLLEVDLHIISIFGSMLHQLTYFGFHHLAISEEIENFQRMMLAQIDLRIEGKNLDQFASNFENNPSVRFPTYIPHLSNENVLVETFMDGILMQDFIDYGRTSFHDTLADAGFRAFAQMVLTDNFCHSDMHPGNILVSFMPPPSKNKWSLFSDSSVDVSIEQDLVEQLSTVATKIEWTTLLTKLSDRGFIPYLVALDVGLVNVLQEENLKNVRDCFQAGLAFDGETLASLFISRSRYPDQVINCDQVKDRFDDMTTSMELDSKGRLLLSQIFAIDIVGKFSKLIRDHHISLPGDFSGLLVAGLTVEGMGRALNADLDILEVLVDYL